MVQGYLSNVGYPTKESGQQHSETQKINSGLQPQTKIDNKMKHIEIMQHKIETAIRSHIKGEIICLDAMLPEHQEVEAGPLMAFKAPFYPDTKYMHQAIK